MKQSINILLLLIITITCAGCVSFCRIDGPYKGRIVDAETNQPLEGVVVLGVWNKVNLNVVEATRSFYDSIEVTTDKNGEFNIKGQGLLLLLMIDDEMNIVIFKAGYEMRGEGPWSGFRTRTGGRNVHWVGNYPTFFQQLPVRFLPDVSCASTV